MIGGFLEGRLLDGRQVMIVSFVPGLLGTVLAVVVTPSGSMESVAVESLSADWHYDSARGQFVADFERDEAPSP